MVVSGGVPLSCPKHRFLASSLARHPKYAPPSSVCEGYEDFLGFTLEWDKNSSAGVLIGLFLGWFVLFRVGKCSILFP